MFLSPVLQAWPLNENETGDLSQTNNYRHGQLQGNNGNICHRNSPSFPPPPPRGCDSCGQMCNYRNVGLRKHSIHTPRDAHVVHPCINIFTPRHLLTSALATAQRTHRGTGVFAVNPASNRETSHKAQLPSVLRSL